MFRTFNMIADIRLDMFLTKAALHSRCDALNLDHGLQYAPIAMQMRKKLKLVKKIFSNVQVV